MERCSGRGKAGIRRGAGIMKSITIIILLTLLFSCAVIPKQSKIPENTKLEASTSINIVLFGVVQPRTYKPDFRCGEDIVIGVDADVKDSGGSNKATLLP